MVKWEKLQGYKGKCTFKGGWCKSKTLASPFSIYFPQTDSEDASLPPSQMHRRSRAKLSPVYSLRPSTAQLHSECPFKVPVLRKGPSLEVPTNLNNHFCGQQINAVSDTLFQNQLF